jgi:L,D-peptidoglycan transpeptidase YkuD (ErfK/YbiS/YcfS/YnhG family)
VLSPARAPILVTGNRLAFGDFAFRCAVGRNGFAKDKCEGDGCTPLGTFPLRECLYRADRLPAIVTELPLAVIGEDDGWCDDPFLPEYNRPIKIPAKPSPRAKPGYEHLWREDRLYDIVVPLGYNDNPVKAGKGSAIFLHIAKPNDEPTDGCVALALPDLLLLLPYCHAGTMMEIREK